MDWEMPVMNGLECIVNLKKNSATKDIPVIMTTGVMLSPEDLSIAFETGAIDYIRKPIDKTELDARIYSALRLKQYYIDKINVLREKEKTEKESIKKELTVKLMQLSQNNEINNEIVSLLENHCNNQDVRIEFKALKKQIVKIISKDNIPNIWSEFELYFSKTNIDFINNLKGKHPNLTSNERRLCSFLHLGLTTKEIAAITLKTTRSIEIARTRLRDKLNLKGKDIEINTYLNEGIK